MSFFIFLFYVKLNIPDFRPTTKTSENLNYILLKDYQRDNTHPILKYSEL